MSNFFRFSTNSADNDSIIFEQALSISVRFLANARLLSITKLPTDLSTSSKNRLKIEREMIIMLILLLNCMNCIVFVRRSSRRNHHRSVAVFLAFEPIQLGFQLLDSIVEVNTLVVLLNGFVAFVPILFDQSLLFCASFGIRFMIAKVIRPNRKK